MEEGKQIEIHGEPLQLKKEVELKVYAVAAITKDMFEREGMAANKEKFILSLTMAYDDASALAACAHSIKHIGHDPNLYRIPTAIVGFSLKDIIASVGIVPGGTPPELPSLEAAKPIDFKEQAQKSKESMAASVRYIFDQCGTVGQKKAAEVVIKKFLQNASA